MFNPNEKQHYELKQRKYLSVLNKYLTLQSVG